MEERTLLLEVDFLNNYILEDPSTRKKIPMDPNLVTKFLTEVSDFWHTDVDKLDFFQYYSDGSYFCQRKKRTYDFQRESYYDTVYQFKAGNDTEAKDLHDQIKLLLGVTIEVNELKVALTLKNTSDDITYWEQRWHKLVKQKEFMLNSSDWRVLPDVPEKYDGEKARWIAWRAWVRDSLVPSPTDEQFETGLEYFKYTYELKYPIDPSNYRKLYPNDMLEDGVTPAPAFMDENDSNQWVEKEVESSSEFVKKRINNLYNLSKRGEPSTKKVKQNLIDMMKLLNVTEEVPVDWSKYHVDENEV